MRLLLVRSSASQPVPHQKRATLWLMKGYFFLPQGSARLLLKEPTGLRPRRSALPAGGKTNARLRVKIKKAPQNKAPFQWDICRTYSKSLTF